MSADAAVGNRLAPRRRRALQLRNVYRLLSLALLVGVVVVPFISQPYMVQNYTRIFIVALPVIGLNLLTGHGGVVSLGQSAFFGVGAYVSAILIADHAWEWWQAAPVAVSLAFATGVLVGIPALRIRGVQLAITTLVLAALFPGIIMRFSETTGGNRGKSVPVMRSPAWLGLEPDQYGYLVSLTAVLVAMLLIHNWSKSRAARAFNAVRDNETAAAMMGVNVARTKVVNFGVSAAAGGLGGSLFVATQGVVSSQTSYLTLNGAIQFLCAMVLGGSGTVLGPLVGATLTERVPVFLAGINPVLAPVVYGAILIGVVLWMRDGVVGGISRACRALAARTRRHVASGEPEDPSVHREKA
jgi:branched-chain amino acid transport system permease protein